MKTVKLTLNELLILDRELNGLVDPKSGTIVFRGILSHKMDIVSKYRLSKIAKIINDEKELHTTMRNELVKTYADDLEAETIRVSPTIKNKKGEEIPNPKHIEFIKELEKLGLEEKEIEFPEINVEDLKFETDEYYNILFEKIL